MTDNRFVRQNQPELQPNLKIILKPGVRSPIMPSFMNQAHVSKRTANKRSANSLGRRIASSNRRALRLEMLERRQMMAGDLSCNHSATEIHDLTCNDDEVVIVSGSSPMVVAPATRVPAGSAAIESNSTSISSDSSPSVTADASSAPATERESAFVPQTADKSIAITTATTQDDPAVLIASTNKTVDNVAVTLHDADAFRSHITKGLDSETMGVDLDSESNSILGDSSMELLRLNRVETSSDQSQPNGLSPSPEQRTARFWESETVGVTSSQPPKAESAAEAFIRTLGIRKLHPHDMDLASQDAALAIIAQDMEAHAVAAQARGYGVALFNAFEFNAVEQPQQFAMSKPRIANIEPTSVDLSDPAASKESALVLPVLNIKRTAALVSTAAIVYGMTRLPAANQKMRLWSVVQLSR